MEDRILELQEKIDGLRNKYFRYDDDCRAHDRTRCSSCTTKMEGLEAGYQKAIEKLQIRQDINTSEPKSIALVPLDVRNDDNAACENAKAVESFEKQVEMIQEVFGLSDEEISKMKVNEVATKVKLAKEKATIGNMRNLLDRPSFLGKLLCKIR